MKQKFVFNVVIFFLHSRANYYTFDEMYLNNNSIMSGMSENMAANVISFVANRFSAHAFTRCYELEKFNLATALINIHATNEPGRPPISLPSLETALDYYDGRIRSI